MSFNWRRRRDSFLAFRKAKVLVYMYALLHTSVIAKNNSQDCFLDAFVQISPTSFVLNENKRTPKKVFIYFGGEGEIRTLETLLTLTRFPVVRPRPDQATSP